MKNKNRHLVKNVIGTLTIPVLVAVLLQGICMFNGKTMISNMTGFDNFVVYICLLYTSPSPRDRSVSRMPSSA